MKRLLSNIRSVIASILFDEEKQIVFCAFLGTLAMILAAVVYGERGELLKAGILMAMAVAEGIGAIIYNHKYNK